jgi:hypothetical protein
VLAGAHPTVKARNREVLYALSREFEQTAAKERKQKAFIRSGPLSANSNDDQNNGGSFTVQSMPSPSYTLQRHSKFSLDSKGKDALMGNQKQKEKMKAERERIVKLQSQECAEINGSAGAFQAPVQVSARKCHGHNLRGPGKEGAAPVRMLHGQPGSQSMGERRKRPLSDIAVECEEARALSGSSAHAGGMRHIEEDALVASRQGRPSPTAASAVAAPPAAGSIAAVDGSTASQPKKQVGNPFPECTASNV